MPLPATNNLSPRETQVLQLMARGLANKAIAHELGIGAGSVRGYLEVIYRKLGAPNRTAAADVARKRGLLQ